MIAENMGAGTTELHILRARLGVDARWVLYALKSHGYLREGVTAFEGVAGLQRVLQEFVANFSIADVPLEEQRRIADFLDERVALIDQIIAAREKQIAAAEESFSAQAQAAFIKYSTSNVAIRRLLRRAPSYGVLPASTSDNPDWPRYIRTTDISDLGYLRADIRMSVDPKYLSDYEVAEGDVLVARSGNTIGKCIVFDGSERSVFAGYIVRLQFSNLNPETFWYFSQTKLFQDRLWSNAIQATIPNFSADRYAAMQIPDVRRHEQQLLSDCELAHKSTQRIARVLRDQVDLLREYKQSLITAAVTGEFDVATASTRIREHLS